MAMNDINKVILSDPALDPIWQKICRNEELSFEDGMACLRTQDMTGLGTMADHVKTALWGQKVYFVFNRQINPTNLCVLSCKFCQKERAGWSLRNDYRGNFVKNHT